MTTRTNHTEPRTQSLYRTSTVRVRVGNLDGIQAREMRRVLRDLAARPHTRIVVDLTALDDRHELTLFTLLAEASRRLPDPASELVVVQPPARLARYLVATHVRVAPDGLLPSDEPCALRLDFGAFEDPACSTVAPAGDGRPHRVACALADECTKNLTL